MTLFPIESDVLPSPKHLGFMKPLTLLCLLALPALAQETMPGAKTATGQQNWNIYQDLTKSGFSFPVTYTGEVLGNPVGGNHQGAIYDGLLEAGVQIDLNQLMHWQGASFTADAFYPHGSSLTRKDVHDLNVLSNIDALHDPRLNELWLQQVLFDGNLSICAGQISAGTDFFVTSYGTP